MNVIDLEKGIEMITKSYMIGLPGSGKTTFLGALGYYILNDDEKEGTYQIDTIENMDYIREIGEIWVQCQIISRTKVGYFVNNKLLLHDRQNNKIEIQIPDQSGETFEHNLKARNLKESMFNDLRECSVVFMFINPSKMSKNVWIYDIPGNYRNAESGKLEETKEVRIHDQAKYIMLLQDIYVVRKKRTKIKIIVSAWDNYMEKDISPEELLKTEVPMVWQFLEANKMNFECEYWGVSAQGGDWSSEEEQERLQNIDHATDRIIVVDNGKNRSHDITAILR